jgi:hypothetical protein
MRVVQQATAEQDRITTLRTNVRAMGSNVANKTATSSEEEIGIVV